MFEQCTGVQQNLWVILLRDQFVRGGIVNAPKILFDTGTGKANLIMSLIFVLRVSRVLLIN